MNATPARCAGAGVWSGMGMASAQAWLDHHDGMTAHSEDLLLLLAFVVFVALPAYLFVFGGEARPFRRDVASKGAERAGQGGIFRRMVVWLACAGAVGMLWSLALAAALRGP